MLRVQEPASWQTRRLQVPVAGKNGSQGSKTCMAEDQCISKFCGKGYDHTSQKFPYSVNYTKWAWEGEDVFDFRVRYLHACWAGLIACNPVQYPSCMHLQHASLHIGFTGSCCRCAGTDRSPACCCRCV